MAAARRARSTGRYTYDGRLERVCTCGRTFGAHDAEAPHPFGEDDGGPPCARFRPRKEPKENPAKPAWSKTELRLAADAITRFWITNRPLEGSARDMQRYDARFAVTLAPCPRPCPP